MLSRWMNGKSDQRTRRWRMLTLSWVDFLRCCQEKWSWFFFFLFICHSSSSWDLLCVLGSPIKSINFYRTCFFIYLLLLQIQSHMFFLSVPMNRAGNDGSSCHLLTAGSCHWTQITVLSTMLTSCYELHLVHTSVLVRLLCQTWCHQIRHVPVQAPEHFQSKNGVDFVDWHHLWLLNSLRSRLPTGNSVHYCKNGVAYICFTAARVPLQPLFSLFNSLSLENS